MGVFTGEYEGWIPHELGFLYNINAGGTTLRFILAIISIPPFPMKVHATGTTL